MQPPEEAAPSPWKYLGHCVERDRFEIGGVSVWEHKWHRVPGLHAEIKDPLYRQAYSFPVYEIRTERSIVRFAAGEYSANVWGFYSAATT
jgi:hypothetical protein